MTKLYVFDPSYLRKDTDRIDYWGIGLLALWVGTLQLALDLGQERDWFSSLFITALVVTSGIGLVAFLIREWVAREPVVDLRVFKERTYAVGVFLMTVVGFVLYGSLVLLPIMLQTLLGYPVTIDQGFSNPAATSTTTNFGVFGDLMAGYVVRNVRQVELLVNPYSRMQQRQIEYSSWFRFDALQQDTNAYTALTGT